MPKLESAYTIQQHKNILKSIEVEFNTNLTGHLWSAILLKQRAREEKRKKSGRERKRSQMADKRQGETIPDNSDAETRKRGRGRLPGPNDIVTKSWASWPLPKGSQPSQPLSTSTPSNEDPSDPQIKPQPLQEALIALFLHKATQDLRSQGLPVSADDDVANHSIRPIVGGILNKLDNLLVTIHEQRLSTCKDQTVKKLTPAQRQNKTPLSWSGVLGLAAIGGWDQHNTKAGSIGAVRRTTQRMCKVLDEKMEWRVWPKGSEDYIPVMFPLLEPEAPSDQTTKPNREAILPESTLLTPQPDSPRPAANKRKHGLSDIDLCGTAATTAQAETLGGEIHRSGFLDLIPTPAERAKRRKLLGQMSRIAPEVEASNLELEMDKSGVPSVSDSDVIMVSETEIPEAQSTILAPLTGTEGRK